MSSAIPVSPIRTTPPHRSSITETRCVPPMPKRSSSPKAKPPTATTLPFPCRRLHSVSGTLVDARSGAALNHGYLSLYSGDDKDPIARGMIDPDLRTFYIPLVLEGEYRVKVSSASELNRELLPPVGDSPIYRPPQYKERAVQQYDELNVPLLVHNDVTGLALALTPSAPQATRSETEMSSRRPITTDPVHDTLNPMRLLALPPALRNRLADRRQIRHRPQPRLPRPPPRRRQGNHRAGAGRPSHPDFPFRLHSRRRVPPQRLGRDAATPRGDRTRRSLRLRRLATKVQGHHPQVLRPVRSPLPRAKRCDRPHPADATRPRKAVRQTTASVELQRSLVCLLFVIPEGNLRWNLHYIIRRRTTDPTPGWKPGASAPGIRRQVVWGFSPGAS